MSVINTLPFAQIPEWLLDAPVSDRAVRLYGILARYAGKQGHAHPSRRTLAERLGCSLDSVDRALAELCQVGILEVRHRPAAEGSKELTTNDYILRPGSRTAAAGGSRTGAAENESHIELPEREITSVISLSGAKRRRARNGSPRNDPIYETLFALETGEAYSAEARSRLTRKAADALNAAAAEIRATGISRDELRAAIAAWPRVMGDATCTAHAVAKHLPRLRAAARGLVARRSEFDEVAAEVERRLEARGSR
jgi:DNA-binding transcriptional MocR family regulator